MTVTLTVISSQIFLRNTIQFFTKWTYFLKINPLTASSLQISTSSLDFMSQVDSTERVVTIQVPLTEASQQFFSSSKSSYSTAVIISGNTDKYVMTLLEKWGSSGLSVAVLRKDESAPNSWRHEFGSYGIAHADGS